MKQIKQKEFFENEFTINGKTVVILFQQQRKQMVKDDISKKILNGVQLQHKKIFGLVQNNTRSSFIIDQNKLVYFCGKNIIIYDPVTSRFKTFPRNLSEKQIKFIDYYLNFYGDIMVGYISTLQSKNYYLFSLFQQSTNFIQSFSFNCLDIILDMTVIKQCQNFILLTTNHNKYKINIYETYNANKLYSIDCNEIGIQQPKMILHNTQSSYNCCFVITQFQAFICQFNQDGSTEMNKFQLKEEIIDCCYNQKLERLCIMTNTRMLLHKFNTPNSTIELKLESTPTCCHSNANLVVVGHNQKEITVFNIENNQIQNIYFKCQNFQRIVFVNVSLDNQLILILVQQYLTKQASHIKFGPICTMKQEDSKLFTNKVPSFQIFSQLIDRQHNEKKTILALISLPLFRARRQLGFDPMDDLFSPAIFNCKINQIAISTLKPIFVVIGKDKTLKMFMLDPPFDILWRVQFIEEANSISLHPIIQMMAISFKQNFKIYFFMDNDIKFSHSENIQRCTKVEFSKGGHWLAVIGKSGYIIYNAYSYQKVYVNMNFSELCGTTLKFLLNDSLLMYSDKNQNCYILQTGSFIKVAQLYTKQPNTVSVQYDPFYDLFLVGTNFLRIYQANGQYLYYEIKFDFQITIIWIIKQLELLLLGFANGVIRTYLWPLERGADFSKQYMEYQTHQGKVTSVAISSDLKYLVSGGEEGSIYIFRLQYYSFGQEQIIDQEFDNQIKGKSIYLLKQFHYTSQANEKQINNKLIVLEQNYRQIKNDKQEDIKIKKNELQNMLTAFVQVQKNRLIQLQDNHQNCMKQHNKRIQNINQTLSQLRKNEFQYKLNMQEQLNQSLKQIYQKHIELIKQLDRRNMILKQQTDKLQSQNNRNIQQALFEYQQIQIHQNILIQNQNQLSQKHQLAKIFLQTQIKFQSIQEMQFIFIRQLYLGKLNKIQEEQNKYGENQSIKMSKIKNEISRHKVRKSQINFILHHLNQDTNNYYIYKNNHIKQLAIIKQKLVNAQKIICQKQKLSSQIEQNNMIKKNKESHKIWTIKELEEIMNPLINILLNLQLKVDNINQKLVNQLFRFRNLTKKIEIKNQQLHVIKMKSKQYVYKILDKKRKINVVQNVPLFNQENNNLSKIITKIMEKISLKFNSLTMAQSIIISFRTSSHVSYKIKKIENDQNQGFQSKQIFKQKTDKQKY